MARINVAFEILGDPDSRQQYDEYLWAILAADAARSGPNADVRHSPQSSAPAVPLWKRAQGWLVSIAVFAAIGGCQYFVGQEESKDEYEKANQRARVATPISDSSKSGSTTTTTSKTQPITQVQVGQCVADQELGTLSSIEVVPCQSARAHLRVVHGFTVALNGAYPGEAYFERQADSKCPETTDSWLFPVPSGWSLGDRTVHCLAPVR